MSNEQQPQSQRPELSPQIQYHLTLLDDRQREMNIKISNAINALITENQQQKQQIKQLEQNIQQLQEENQRLQQRIQFLERPITKDDCVSIPTQA